MIRLAIDASVDGQFGPAGVGILWVENGQQQQIAIPLDHKMDNHEAEFWALYYALNHIKAYNKTEELIICQTDSRIVYDAVRKRHHKKEPYKSILEQILELIDETAQFNLKWTSDQNNKGADHLARQAMHKVKSI